MFLPRVSLDSKNCISESIKCEVVGLTLPCCCVLCFYFPFVLELAPAVRELIFTLPRKVMHGSRQSEGYVLELGKYALRACSERKIFTSAA